MPSAERTTALDYDRMASWLMHEEVRYAVLASARQDGSPVAIPLGYHYSDRYLYLSINTTDGKPRPASWRMRRDPRVSVCITDDRYPPSYVIVTGRAEEVDDPGNAISKQIMLRYQSRVAGLDLARFEARWLGGGRHVFRIPVDEVTCRFRDGALADPLIYQGTYVGKQQAVGR